MADTEITQSIHDLYAAFNRRDSSFAIQQMTENVTWPRAFKGGFVTGPDAVSAYWREQWTEIDPIVEPTAIEVRDDGSVDVEVHQVVRDLEGTVIADTVVHHTFTFAGPKISGMTLDE